MVASYFVTLKKHEDKRIRAGHPWVYANEAAKIEGKGKNGDLAAVYAYDGTFLGRGFINHLSKILVRLFLYDEDTVPDEAFFTARIREAVGLRQKLGYDDCYRAVFGESDGLPALIVDKYHDLLSVQVLSLGMERCKDDIVRALAAVFSPRGIYERSDVSVREKEGLAPVKGPLYGDFSPRVVIEENGLRLTADLENGQKTGYFLDQKENRYAIRRYAAGEAVLDCFCNVGGFAVNAAAAGARRVVAVDVSEKAIADVKANAALNGLTVETVCGDGFEVLRALRAEGTRFGLVILDPPAFCKTAADVPDALRGYRDVNILGMKLVKSGGFLATASCSQHIAPAVFEKMLREAAVGAGRRVRVIERRSQSPDHAALLASDETAYLKFFILQIL